MNPNFTLANSLKRQWLRHSGTRLPVIVFLLGLGLAVATALLRQNQVNMEAEAEFQRGVQRVTSEIRHRFGLPVYGLKGLQSVYAVYPRLKRAEFVAAVEARNLRGEFPGVRGFGFIARVARADLGAFVAAERADGAPQFAIRQLIDKELDDLLIIKFIEPARANVGAMGLDIGSEAARRTAAQQAVDTGIPAMTRAITLVQDQRQSVGVLMFVPVYAQGANLGNVAQRRASLVGLLYAPIVINELLEGVNLATASGLDFELRQGAPDSTLLFTSNTLGPQATARVPLFVSAQPALLAGREMSLRVFSTPEFESRINHALPWRVLATGILLSALLALLLRQLSTGKRRAELLAERMTAQLRHDEERSNDFSVCASDWRWETDEQQRFSYFSENFEKFYGRKPTQLLGQRRQDLWAFDAANSPKAVTDHLAQLEAHLPFKDFEYQVRANDGAMAWISVTGRPFFDSNGRFLGYRGVGSVVTARKQVEIALALEVANRAETERVFNDWLRLQSAALDACANALLIVGVDGVIQWVNQAFCQLSGYDAAEAVGHSPDELVKSGVQDDAFYAKLWQRVLSGQAWKGELINRRKDGTRYCEEMTITPVCDALGQVSHFIVVKEDVTEHKRIEEAAQAANRTKSEFLANMSHEIRTPMNGVIGMVDVLQQTRLEPGQSRMLATIQQSSMVLLNILNDILDFSKIEAGKLTVERIPIHLRELLEGVAQLMVASCNVKAIALSLFVSPALPQQIVSDPTRLRQVLLNLLGNAVKFTSGHLGRPAKVMLVVEPCTLAQGQAGLRLRVTDSGIGISPEVLVKLFQPFMQADESTARRFGGTGLGLSNSQRLVELLGGRISVRSELGEGSEFCVELALQEPPHGSMPMFGPSLQGLQLLVAVQDEEVGKIVCAYALAAAAEVTVLPGLGAVCQHLQETPPTGPTVLVLGGETMLTAGELELPAGVGMVQLRAFNHQAEANAAALCSHPLLYHELMDAIAQASGRTSLVTAPLVSHTDALVARQAPSVEQALAIGQLVLLVDDNETNRDVVTEQLRLLGYACEVAEDGVQALALWRSGRYALLLTDCHMPHMDGFKLAEAIRQAEAEVEAKGRRLPIVAITANAMQGEAQRCLARGMDDYLSKPLRMVELAPMLHKWLPLATRHLQALPDESAAAPQSLPAWDAFALGKMVGDNPAMQRRLLLRYLVNAGQQVAAIALACEAGELDVVADVAHALKSASRMVGALQLGELCEQIETAGSDGEGVVCSALHDELAQALAQARVLITQHLESLAA